MSVPGGAPKPPPDCKPRPKGQQLSENDALKKLSIIGGRFTGIDLKYRRHGTQWPKPWQARLIVSKKERSEWRIYAFGDTAGEAIEKLDKLLKEIDNKNKL